MTPSRALWTRGVLVKTFDPGMAGIAHDATGLGDLSTYRDEKEYRGDAHLDKTHSAIPSNG